MATMKDRKHKTGAPILAAGGIVLRGERKPQIAIVQLRKMGAWVLPKGKLAAGESAMAAARREVLEETGHRVSIHEFVGTLAYEAGGRPKVVQFWRMQAIGGPAGPLMRDVKAVEWLALDEAIEQLTHAREQAFLAHVGPIALKSSERSARRAVVNGRTARQNLVERARPLPVPHVVEPAEWFAPVDLTAPLPDAAPIGRSWPVEPVRLVEQRTTQPAERVTVAGAPATFRTGTNDATAGRNVLKRTLVWFRQTTQPRLRRD
jgi:8-oxo-dGTP diphosphatase